MMLVATTERERERERERGERDWRQLSGIDQIPKGLE